MDLQIDSLDTSFSIDSRRLMQRTLSPITGITQGLGVFLGNSHEPQFVVAGAELTGMHVIQGRNPPTRSMHIGGCGSTFKEAIMPALAEALERYSQLWAGMQQREQDTFCSSNELDELNKKHIALDKLTMFNDNQYQKDHFPFQKPQLDTPMTWSAGLSLTTNESVLAPSQQLFLGYMPRLDDGERWIAPAVTTGTAVHTTPLLAFRNALLELVQLDSAMGHWLGHKDPIKIIPDKRTARLTAVAKRLLGDSVTAEPHFYWLQNADLHHFTVACVLHDAYDIPAAVVGLGSDLILESAMYKSLAESSGIYQLAKLVMLQEMDSNGGKLPTLDTSAIYDLDLNVVHHASRSQAAKLLETFNKGTECKASDLPSDPKEEIGPDIIHLVDDFKKTGKELLYYDLTTPDLKQVGFYSTRVWSPDTISLSLPSAPVFGHNRLDDYGGANTDAGIHPYP